MTTMRIDLEEIARLRRDNDRLRRLLNEYQQAAYAQVRASRRIREYREAHSFRAKVRRATEMTRKVSDSIWQILDALPKSAAIMVSGVAGTMIAATIIMMIARWNL